MFFRKNGRPRLSRRQRLPLARPNNRCRDSMTRAQRLLAGFRWTPGSASLLLASKMFSPPSRGNTDARRDLTAGNITGTIQHGRPRLPRLLSLRCGQDRVPRLLAARDLSARASRREIRSRDHPCRPHRPFFLRLPMAGRGAQQAWRLDLRRLPARPRPATPAGPSAQPCKAAPHQERLMVRINPYCESGQNRGF